MSASALRVGMVGLGNMGAAMAANLVRGGVDVVGFDPDPARCSSASAEGVAAAADIAGVARTADVIITSLPSATIAASVLEEIVQSATAPRILIETSTLSPHDKEALARQVKGSSHILLDCPLSGTSAQARSRDLTILASGEPEAIARVEGLLRLIGRVRHVGAFGAGTQVKLIANLLVAIHNVSTAECLSLGVRAGLDPEMLIEVLGTGAGASRMLEVRGPVMASRTYQPAAMTLGLWAKDIALITDFAKSCASPTPLFDTVKSLYARTSAEQDGADDTAAVFEQYLANLQSKPGS